MVEGSHHGACDLDQSFCATWRSHGWGARFRRKANGSRSRRWGVGTARHHQYLGARAGFGATTQVHFKMCLLVFDFKLGHLSALHESD